jgi:hypothetical protein
MSAHSDLHLARQYEAYLEAELADRNETIDRLARALGWLVLTLTKPAYETARTLAIENAEQLLGGIGDDVAAV